MNIIVPKRNIAVPRRDLIVPNRTRQRGFIINPFVHAAAGPQDPYFANVISLVHFDNVGGGAPIDVIGNTWTLTSITIGGSNPKFGSGALDSAGSGGYAESTAAAYALGSGDWTIEGWYYAATSSLTGFRGLIDFRPTGTNGLYPTIYFQNQTLHFFTNSANRISSGASYPHGGGPYGHIAVSKASGTTKMFVDGTQVGSSYTDSNTYIGTRIRLLNFGDSVTGQCLGNFDEFRVTKGVGRYTSNFTAPAAAFPNS